MSRPYMKSLDVQAVGIACPNCGTDVEVTELRYSQVCAAPAACGDCEYVFTGDERVAMERTAAKAIRDFDPTDEELESSRLCAYPTIAERLEEARRMK